MSVMDFVRTPDERFADLPDFDVERRSITLANGLRLAFVEAGPGAAETVLLLHGQPTWSYLYRHVMAALAGSGYRAIAADMIGFGRSDKPTERTAYSVRDHSADVLALVSALGLSGVTLVVQDWGGPVGLGALARAPEYFARVVATNTALHTADALLAGRLDWACHATSEGRMDIEPALLDYQRMTQEVVPFAPSLFVQGATASDLPPEVCRAYDAPFPDEAFCAGARQLPLLMGLTPHSAGARHNRRIFEFLAASDIPLVTAFSDGDPGTRGWDRVLREAALGARGQLHHTIAGAGHFVQEDQGPALAEAIVSFAESTPR
jgi:haloalkane dehalogenase